MIDFHNAIVSVFARTSSGFVLQGHTLETDWVGNCDKLCVHLNLPNGNSVVRSIQKKHIWLVGVQNECAFCSVRVESLSLSEDIVSCHLCGLVIHKACLQQAKLLHDPSKNYLISLDASGLCMKCLHMKCFSYCAFRGVSPYLARFYQTLASKQVQRHLNWDSFHRHNEENSYCYCQGPGIFSYHMLQCANCEQWFHELCVMEMATNYQSLLSHKLNSNIYLKRRTPPSGQHVMIPWDFSWFFLCRLCNRGVEFLWKIQLNLVEALHLALEDINQNKNSPFAHIDHDILPWLRRFWTRLRLQVKMSWSEVEKSILNALMENPARFQCQLEVDLASQENVGHHLPDLSDERYLKWRLRSPKGGMIRPKLLIESKLTLPVKYNISTTKLCSRISDSPADWITLNEQVDSFPQRAVYELVRYSTPYQDARLAFLNSCRFCKPTASNRGDSERSESISGATKQTEISPIPCQDTTTTATSQAQTSTASCRESVQSSTQSPQLPNNSTEDIHHAESSVPPPPESILSHHQQQQSNSSPSYRETSSPIVEVGDDDDEQSESSSAQLPPQTSCCADALHWVATRPGPQCNSMLRKSFQYSWEHDASTNVRKQLCDWLSGQSLPPRHSVLPANRRNNAVKRIASKGIRTGYEYLSNVAAAELSLARIVARRRPDSSLGKNISCGNSSSQDDNNNKKEGAGVASRKRRRLNNDKVSSVSVKSSDKEEWESLIVWRVPYSRQLASTSS